MINYRSKWLSIDYIIFILFTFIALKLNILSFGSKYYGMWILLSSLFGFGTVLDFGIGMSLVKKVAEYNSRRKETLNDLISSGLAIVFSLSIIILICLYFTGFTFYLNNTNFFQNNYERQYFTEIFIILSLTFYFKYFSQIFRAILEGLDYYVISSKINIIYSSLTLVSSLSVFLLEYSVLILTLLNFLVTLIIFNIYIYYLKKKNKLLKVSLKFISISNIKEILKFSFSVQLINLFGLIIDPVIKYLIGNNYRIEYVTVYEIVRKIAGSISGLFNSSFKYILTEISSLSNSNEHQKYLYESCVLVARYGVTFSGVIFGILSILFYFGIKIFFPYYGTINIFYMIALAEIVNIYSYSIYIFLIGVGNTTWLAITQFINLIITTILLYLGLIKCSNNLGFFSSFIAVLFVNSLTLLYVKYKFKLKIITYLQNTSVYKLFLLVFIYIYIIFLIEFDVNIDMYLVISTFIFIILFYKDINKIYKHIFTDQTKLNSK